MISGRFIIGLDNPTSQPTVSTLDATVGLGNFDM